MIERYGESSLYNNPSHVIVYVKGKYI